MLSVSASYFSYYILVKMNSILFKANEWKTIKKLTLFYLLLIPLAYFLLVALILVNHQTDLCQDYTSASLLIQGESAYLPNDCWGWRIIPLKHNPHPPFSILLFIPFLAFSVSFANLAWLIISVAFYAVTLVLLLKIHKKYSLIALALLFCFSLFWDPLRNATLNQSMIHLLLLLITAAWYLEIKKHDKLSGVIIGIATLFRFWPILFLLPAVLAKKYNLLISALVTISSGFLLTLILFGIKDYQIYFGIIMQEESYQILNPDNISLVGLLAKLLLNFGIELKFSLLLAKLSGFAIFSCLLCSLFFKNAKYMGSQKIYTLTQSIILNMHIIIFPVIWGWGLVIYLVIYAMCFYVLKAIPKPHKSWWLTFGTSVFFLVGLKIYVPRYNSADKSISLFDYLHTIDIHAITALIGVSLLLISQFKLLKSLKKLYAVHTMSQKI